MNPILHPTVLAFDMGEFMGLMIPIIALFIPIVVVLARHQQRMAEIIHGQGVNPQLASEIDALRRQMQQLQYQMAQHAAALEKIGAIAQPASGDMLQERLRS